MKGREAEKQNMMANWLTLLTRVTKNGTKKSPLSDRVFECKTCNKKFHSFQALGGHRASHKKNRMFMANHSPMGAKRKIHECSICGLEFPMGQALGGHMRRHRGEANIKKHSSLLMSNESSEGVIPVLKKCNSKRILLDLNLTPYENELMKMGNQGIFSPALDCF
ncbi:hypothetical protein LIER_43541 [Lithospermum erythrorhizon]|uniref:C2H2-type domain-containing protein n=1 Tax=Lithospermum erythrorhizon TaxID=34254 RepID=A0AAV3QBG8_LITER